MLFKKFLLRHSSDQVVIDIAYGIYWALAHVSTRLAYVVLKVIASIFFSAPGLALVRYGYDHTYVMRLIFAVEEKYRLKQLKLIPRKKRPFSPNGRIRIGVFGALSTPHKDLFINRPENTDLYVYDVVRNPIQQAPWLKTYATKYYHQDCDSINLKTLAEEMNEDQLDILIHVGSFSDIKDYVLNQVEASKIVVYHTGTAVSFSSKVDLDLMHQPQLYCRIKDNRFVCDILSQAYSNAYCVPINFVFNHRNINMESIVPIGLRKKQIVFHGNLYKLDNPNVLRIIVKILRQYNDYHFIFMGANQANALKHIMAYFNNAGIIEQIHYMGVYNINPDCDGNYLGNNYEMFKIIRESRLYIDPWPIAGGNTVFQAYALGVPCVTLKMDADEPVRRLDKTRTTLELNGFVTKMGPIATSSKEYEEACFRIIEDDMYCEKLIEAQIQVAKDLSGEIGISRFWNTIWNELQI